MGDLSGKPCPCGGTYMFMGTKFIHEGEIPLLINVNGMTLNTLELNAYCCDRCGEVRFFNAQRVERPSEKATDLKTLYAGESDKALRRILDGTSYKEEAKRAARELLAERHNGNEAD